MLPPCSHAGHAIHKLHAATSCCTQPPPLDGAGCMQAGCMHICVGRLSEIRSSHGSEGLHLPREGNVGPLPQCSSFVDYARLAAARLGYAYDDEEEARMQARCHPIRSPSDLHPPRCPHLRRPPSSLPPLMNCRRRGWQRRLHARTVLGYSFKPMVSSTLMMQTRRSTGKSTEPHPSPNVH